MSAHGADPAALATLAADCAALGIRRRVLLVRLPPHLARPSRPAARRLLMDELAPFAAADRARLFRLPGGHLAAAWREGARDGGQALERAADRLRQMLEADAEGLPAALAGEVRLCRLPEEAPVVQAFLDSASLAERAAAPPPGRPLDPAELASIEAALAQADVARFARRRRIFRAPDHSPRHSHDHARAAKPPALHLEHRFLDLHELAGALAPGRDLATDPWLLRRLRRTLDRRLLALLTDPAELRLAGPFILDLSVASLRTATFARFDAALPARLRGQEVLRLAAADLLAAPDAAITGLEFARTRFYQTMICGGGTLLAAHRLGADLDEAAWSDDLPAMTHPTLLTDIPDRGRLDQAITLGYRLLEGPALALTRAN